MVNTGDPSHSKLLLINTLEERTSSMRTSCVWSPCALYLDTARASRQTRLADRYDAEKRQDNMEVLTQIYLVTSEECDTAIRHLESEGRLEVVNDNMNIDQAYTGL
ncbi:MAG: hypothetical protein HETSPECPRED_007854 [Heterodermia speciosa]|uniref:Uncharacterized protein n=1 Tax=Heterodermia speciosa TaxID=116794 RepID=A0A8H3FV91_9LECA|nr:MAG: hypothetical protein HETSPECPRED_007854 [Heterodermia speciosa]